MWKVALIVLYLIHCVVSRPAITYPRRYRPLVPPPYPLNTTRVAQEKIDDMMDRLLGVRRR